MGNLSLKEMFVGAASAVLIPIVIVLAGIIVTKITKDNAWLYWSVGSAALFLFFFSDIVKLIVVYQNKQMVENVLIETSNRPEPKPEPKTGVSAPEIVIKAATTDD